MLLAWSLKKCHGDTCLRIHLGDNSTDACWFKNLVAWMAEMCQWKDYQDAVLFWIKIKTHNPIICKYSSNSRILAVHMDDVSYVLLMVYHTELHCQFLCTASYCTTGLSDLNISILSILLSYYHHVMASFSCISTGPTGPTCSVSFVSVHYHIKIPVVPMNSSTCKDFADVYSIYHIISWLIVFTRSRCSLAATRS